MEMFYCAFVVWSHMAWLACSSVTYTEPQSGFLISFLQDNMKLPEQIDGKFFFFFDIFVLSAIVLFVRYFQDLAYKLSKVGKSIENNDLWAAGLVLGKGIDTDWVKTVNFGFHKRSFTCSLFVTPNGQISLIILIYNWSKHHSWLQAGKRIQRWKHLIRFQLLSIYIRFVYSS